MKSVFYKKKNNSKPLLRDIRTIISHGPTGKSGNDHVATKITQKSALIRQKNESVGMVSFNGAKFMFPEELASSNNRNMDPMFDA